MKMSYQKVVLITGASSGIGKETAKLLAAKGFKVYGAARNLDKMKELTAVGVEILSLDITDEKSIENCVKQILLKEKRIDILINNAGYGSFGAVEVVPMEEARRQFEVNLFGLGLLIQKILPIMRNQKSGRIINISSMGAYFGEPNGGWYHATKAALERLSDALRMEVKPFGIDVVLIQPGMIYTEWQEIAQENLIKTSTGTVYEKSAKAQATGMDKMYKMASKPTVIAKTILKASTRKHPKVRYKAGGFAKPLIFLSIITPTRLFDRIMTKSVKG
ncbi:Aerobic energy metabolism [uncultured Paludibacter sp.]|uniref:Aerobic energy metabolism n=1 Tax=uncultured Paludibacter sp. TaxID=497635 RepID=A0A653AKH8_9BACT|nr:Aerobic energy metabolism [uncultured Paludibacter sp.]